MAVDIEKNIQLFYWQGDKKRMLNCYDVFTDISVQHLKGLLAVVKFVVAKLPTWLNFG